MTPDATNPDMLRCYLQQMEMLLSLPLTAARREEVLRQLQRIAEMAQPLMAYPVEAHDEVAGEYHL